MKKIALVSLAVFGALFIIITVANNKPDAEDAKQEVGTLTAKEKENVIKFWEYYRKATDDRMNEQWEQAAKGYRLALELNGQHEDALYYLGNMYLELSNFREAEKCWQKLALVNPRNSRAYLQLGTLYLSSEELFDVDKAESVSMKALTINKEESGPLLLLGEIHLIRGQLEVASSDFKAVTASNFKSTEAYFLQGYIAWKQGDLPKAKELFLIAINNAKPVDHSKNKVIGEGDTRHGKGFGSVTSKSVFQKYMTDLPAVQEENAEQALVKTYNSMDAMLSDVKRKVH